MTADGGRSSARARWWLLGATLWAAVAVVGALLAAALLWRPPRIVNDPFPSATGRQEPSLRLHLPSVAALVAGENRVAFGFTDPGGRALTGRDVAQVSVAIQDVSRGAPRSIAAAGDVRYMPSGWPELSTASYYENAHPLAPGFFKATLRVPGAGRWGLEFTVRRHAGKVFSQQVFPNVLSESLTPAVGAVAPASRNQTLASAGGNLSQLDSDPRLGDVELHRRSIAEVVAARRPAAVLFASPGFDESRLSLPVLEIFRSLRPVYGDRAEFIHVEVYDVDRYRRRLLEGGSAAGRDPVALSATAEEWGVQNYPWLFVIDGKGRVFEKLFGPMARSEIDEILRRLLAERG